MRAGSVPAAHIGRSAAGAAGVQEPASEHGGAGCHHWSVGRGIRGRYRAGCPVRGAPACTAVLPGYVTAFLDAAVLAASGPNGAVFIGGVHRRRAVHQPDAHRGSPSAGHRVAGPEDALDRGDHELVHFGAVAIGPTIGELQASTDSWRPLFWGVAVVAAVALCTLGGGRLPTPDLDAWTSGEPAWKSPPLLARLRRPPNALRKLPPRQREVLVLRFYLDLSEPEIAAAAAARWGGAWPAGARLAGLAALVHPAGGGRGGGRRGGRHPRPHRRPGPARPPDLVGRAAGRGPALLRRAD